MEDTSNVLFGTSEVDRVARFEPRWIPSVDHGRDPADVGEAHGYLPVAEEDDVLDRAGSPIARLCSGSLDLTSTGQD